ncbi:peptidylprolyl isomerase [Hoeflea sp. CAU 1731]
MTIKSPLRTGLLAAGLFWTLAAGAQEPQDRVIATVGGEPVYESELVFAEGDLDPQFARLPEQQRRAAALSALIDIKVMADQAEKAGLAEGGAFERRMQFLRDRTLHNEFFRKEVIEGLSEADVRARYEKEIAAQPGEHEVKARHILVDSEEQAKAIIAELEAGADFEELAKEKSTGPSGPQGGDLGYFTRGRMVPEFEEAAFALEPDDFTREPVKTQFGWHVIKVEEKRDAAPPAFEEVVEQIQRVLLQEQYMALLDKAREGVEIDVQDAELKALFDAVNAEAAAAEGSGDDTK